MATNTNTTTTTEFLIRVRCGGRVYTESVYTYDRETAWGHAARIEAQTERDYGYKATVIGVRAVAQ